MQEVRVGFVGAGGIAERHVGVLGRLDEVRIAAFADPDTERAERLAQRTSARSYADLPRMLDREELDALWICVPPFAHGAPETAAVERGIPFLVEKPLALDLEAAEAIAAGVAAAELVTAVGYHWRYMDTVEEARERLAGSPARLVLGYWLADTPPAPWWRRGDRSGGQMVEQTTHLFDLARTLVGEVERVFATGSRSGRAAFPDQDSDDVSVATVDFAGGAVGTFASTCLLGWWHRIGLHLFAERTAIELHENEIMVDVGRGRPIRRSERDPVLALDRDFLAAVRGHVHRVRTPYAEALRTHRVAVAASRSARQGRPIDLREPANV